MANIAISFSIYSPKYLNKAFLVLNFELFTKHETFIFKQFEGTDFKFDTHSYSSRNIQTRFLLDSGMMNYGLTKNYNFNRTLL